MSETLEMKNPSAGTPGHVPTTPFKIGDTL
ncbi:hypothetical protein GMA8713_01056 [Grimontia marina]|uniref:Uncharacterized protein n=1 Tax=Grimontia marina TaxID=646534 RepID=A0A128EYI2_9GAMM|nr:hypothetical protein GMA8713_01056 [Grimontia marina]